MIEYVCAFLLIALLIVVARSLVGFFPGGTDSAVGVWLYRTTEPVLGRVRRALPSVRLGAVGIDFSPLVVTFAIVVLRTIIC